MRSQHQPGARSSSTCRRAGTETPRVYEQTVTISGRAFRQLFIDDLGHDKPTVLLTNQRHRPVAKLITRYAQRMLIENALSDAAAFST